MCQQRSRQQLLVWGDFGVRMLSSGALTVLFEPELDTREEQQRIPLIIAWQTIPKRSRLTMILLRSPMGSFWIFFGRVTNRGEGLGPVNTRRWSFTTMKSRKGWLWRAGIRFQLPSRETSTLRSLLLLPFIWPKVIIRSIACSNSVIFSKSSKPCIRIWRIW